MAFFQFENNILTVENDRIRRTVRLENSVPMQSTLLDKETGAQWSTDGAFPVFALQGVSLEGAAVSALPCGLQWDTPAVSIRWELAIRDGLPFVESTLSVKGTLPETEAVQTEAGATGVETAANRKNAPTQSYGDSFGSCSESLGILAVELRDCTDHTNSLTRTVEGELYPREKARYDGQICFVSDRMTRQECIALRLSPCRTAQYARTGSDFCVEGIGSMRLCGIGLDSKAVSPQEWTPAYTCVLGLCPTETREAAVRAWFRSGMPRQTPYIMSNTWGDRSQDTCVCESFMLREIDRAAELGVDVVQIDDGWQQGITANSALQAGGVWNGGYRAADPNFWAVDRKKFPNGFDPLIRRAAEHGIALGLWFSPDAADGYANWRLDVETLDSLYQTYGIAHFKLDGIDLPDRRAERNLVSMLKELHRRSGGKMVFNMDITAGRRLGYLPYRELGNLFVENRYTDWKNYYPHTTLHNLWQIARYIPACQLQFEVLNLRRNAHLYRSCLAPDCYDADYAFAVSMAALPLIWMEMTNLQEEDARRLKAVIEAYKRVRDDLIDAEPIGECPTGYSLTGFILRGKKQDYLLYLRENTDRTPKPWEVLPPLKRILATNDPNAAMDPPTLTRPRSYLFGILQNRV